MDRVYRPHCPKILPTVYDDSLSYYEAICKLTHKMNELIEWINGSAEGMIKEIVLKQLDEFMLSAIYHEDEETIYFARTSKQSDIVYYDTNDTAIVVAEEV